MKNSAQQLQKFLKQNNNNAVIFTKVASYLQTNKNNEIEAQRVKCLHFAKLLNLDVIKSFDATNSNPVYKTIEEIEKMLCFIKEHKISNIIVYSYDRFTRKNTLSIIKKIENLGINVLSTTQSKVTSINNI